MRVLVDTHALLWWFDGDPKLSAAARKLIDDEDTTVLVSAASAWEISTKARIGKLPHALPIARRLPEAIEEQGFESLPVSVLHGHRAGWLGGLHKDPFDRLLAAQALIENLPLVTNDPKLKAFGVRALW